MFDQKFESREAAEAFGKANGLTNLFYYSYAVKGGFYFCSDKLFSEDNICWICYLGEPSEVESLPPGYRYRNYPGQGEG